MALLMMVLAGAGCSVPSQQLSIYREVSLEAADATTAMWLQARIDARRIADHRLNHASASERSRQLATRLEDIRFRLEAVELINRYDAALIALAEGRDPDAIESDVRGILTGLKSIPLAPIGRFVGEVTPYAGAISAAIDLLESAVRARRFHEAVAAAAPAITAISELLTRDAQSLAEIRTQLVMLEHDEVNADLIRLVATFSSLAASPDGWATINDQARRTRFESAIAGVRRLPPLALAEPGQPGQIDAAIAATVEQMIVDASGQVRRLTEIDFAVAANGEAASAYGELLATWRQAHDSLRDTSGQVDLHAARDMLKSILNVREAWMAASQATNRAE